MTYLDEKVAEIKQYMHQTRTEVSEYVKDALLINQKIPYIDTVKADYAKNINNLKKTNWLKSAVMTKQEQLRRLESQLKLLMMEDHVPPPCKIPHLEPDKLEGELLTTDVYHHMIARDKRILLKKVSISSLS